MGTVMEERVKKMLGGNLKCEPRETLDIRGEGLRRLNSRYDLWMCGALVNEDRWCHIGMLSGSNVSGKQHRFFFQISSLGVH